MKKLLSFVFFFSTTTSASGLHKKDVIDLLKSSSLRWQQTEGQRQEAEAKLMQAEAALSPFLSITARQMVAKINPIQYGVTLPDESNWIGAGSLGLQGGIALWDSASGARIKAAKANVRIHTANEKHLRNELISLALVQFLTLQKAKRQQEVIAASIARDQNILQAAKSKYSTGFGISLDVERAEGLVEQQRFKMIEAETNQLKACQELASTLGTKNLNCDVEPLQVRMISEAQLEEIGKARLIEKSDIRASEATLEAAEALRQEAKNELKPKIIAFGETSFVGASIPAGLDRPVTGLVGIQISMPIFSGELHKGKNQEQAAKATLAHLQRDQIAIESQNQLKVAIAQIKSARAALAVSQRQIDIATKELDFAKKKRSTGSIGALELHTALVNLSNATELNVQIQFAHEVAKVNFCRSVGSTDLCIEDTTQESTSESKKTEEIKK